MPKQILTQERLKELLYYGQDTGLFVWRVNIAKNVKKGDKAGCVHENGYAYVGLLGSVYSAHRLAFMYVEGCFPKEKVDHINRDTTDNRWLNLRHADDFINMRNRKTHKNNTSGVAGVTYGKNEKLWVSRIGGNKNRIIIYRGNDFFEACCLRKSAELKHGYIS